MRTFPSTREKKRYLVFEVISNRKHDFEAIKDALLHAFSSFLGVSGSAKAKPRILQDKWDKEKQKGIIAVERKSVWSARAAMCMATKAGDEKAIIRTIGTSGIMKKAIAKYY